MAGQTFERYELKYILNREQKQAVLEAMKEHMLLDSYGRTTIRNIYYDTADYRLIRRSLEKPAYKEKLRVRSYHQANKDSTVFVELKKKYKDVVYKRRLSLKERQVTDSFSKNKPLPIDTQISREIEYFRDFYGDLQKAVFLSYEREAFFALDKSDFRVTFDENILFRQDNIDLKSPAYGQRIIDQDQTLMELKCPGYIPMWMCKCLTENQIRKTSFSKYGAAYQMILRESQEERRLYA